MSAGPISTAGPVPKAAAPLLFFIAYMIAPSTASTATAASPIFPRMGSLLQNVSEDCSANFGNPRSWSVRACAGFWGASWTGAGLDSGLRAFVGGSGAACGCLAASALIGITRAGICVLAGFGGVGGVFLGGGAAAL